MDSDTINDIPVQELKNLENISQRTINLCDDNSINTLREIIKFNKNNSGFLSLRTCGDKTNRELLKICEKYEFQHFIDLVDEDSSSLKSVDKNYTYK